MSSDGGWYRRGVVRTIAGVGAVGALAGCNSGDGDGSDGTDGGSGDDGGTGGDGGTTTTQPEGNSSDGGEGMGGEPGSIEEAVDQANNVIGQINECGPETDLCLQSTNERLNHVEPIEFVEPVEASTPEEARQEAQRLRDEIDRLHNDITDKVPREINEQSLERAGFEIIEDVDQYETAEDFREDAPDMPNERARTAMEDAADGMERLENRLTTVADNLEAAADEAESS